MRQEGMINLGNHGWGIREMIIYLCIFAVILIFVAISINSLYKRIETDNQETKQNEPIVVEPEKKTPVEETQTEQPRAVDYVYYQDLEAKVYNATYAYLQKNPTEIGAGILKIDADTLVNLGFMDPLYNDIKNSKCTGYSNVYVQEGDTDYTVKSYVRCDNYVSEGY